MVGQKKAKTKIKIPKAVDKKMPYLLDHLTHNMGVWGMKGKPTQELVNEQIKVYDELNTSTEYEKLSDLMSELHSQQYSVFRNQHEVLRKKGFIASKQDVEDQKVLLKYHEEQRDKAQKEAKDIIDQIKQTIKRLQW